MKIKDNKGFTMVELLAAITILGILTAVAIGAVSWILQRSRENYYVTLEKNVTMAGENYYADNRASLPKSIGQNRRILLKTLVDKKYLKEVVDYNKADCSASDKSYIKVVKYSKSDYIYKAYFDCPGYKTTEEDQVKDINIQIDFNYNSENISTAISKIRISSTEDNRIASYEYTIYKDGQHAYQSENINAGYVENINREIELERYVPGNIRVVVTAYDIYGNRKTKSKEVSIYNDGVPDCGEQTPKVNKWETNKNASRKITVRCVNNNIDCLRKNFSETFTNDTTTGYITIVGTNDQERKCPVNVMLDTTNPKCGTNNGSTVWTKGNREITLNCSDETSGCKKTQYKQTFTKTTKTTNIEIEDKAGNTENCPVNVYVDKTGPKCGTISGASKTWTNKNRQITVQCIDNESGCKKPSVTQTFTSTTKTGKITIEDKVGNKTECDVNVYVDKTKPTCGTQSPSVSSWTSGSRKISIGCKDNESGCTNSSFSKTFTTPGEKDTITIQDKVGNSQNCSVTKKIEDTPPECPTIKVTTSQKKWTKNNITFTFGFTSDTASWDWYTDSNGSYKFWDNNATSKNSKTISGEGKRKIKVVVYDKAGNKRECFTDHEYWIDKSAPSLSVTLKEKKNSIDLNSSSNISSLSNYSNNSWYSGYVVTRGSCSDNSGSCTVSYKVTGASTNTNGYVNGTTRNINAQGTSTVTFKATDAAGNTATKSYTVKLDRQMPTPGISFKNVCSSSCTNNSGSSYNAVTCNITVTYAGTTWSFSTTEKDNSGGSGYAHWYAYFKGTAGSGCKDNGRGLDWNKWYKDSSGYFGKTGCTKGVYKIQNQDKAGNMSKELTININYSSSCG